ncbi:MAG: PAS domain S-box protein [Thermodesulfobacteriota bacterium]
MNSSNPTAAAPQMRLDEFSFQDIFQDLPIPTVLLGADMKVRAASRSFVQRYGLDAAGVIGRNCYQVFHKSDQPCPAAQCNFPAALRGQRGLYNLHEFVNEQGQQVVEEVHLAPFTDASGRVVGVIESIRDVSEAKRLEASLTATNELLSRLLDSLVGVVLAADLEGRILFVNKSAKRMLDFEPEELVGRTLWELSGHEELTYIRRTLDEQGGQALGVRSTIRRKNGEEIPVRVNTSYVYRDGKPIGTVGIVTDLRDWMKMERHLNTARMQVVQSDKLARLGRMAAGVAHELNNPLTGITVYAELLRESLPPDHPAQEDLRGIVEDAERCRDIVTGLLDYSRQSSVQLEEMDLSQVVEDAFELIRDDSLFLNVEVVRQYAQEKLPIQGDPRLLRQVFINLLSNAVDAMEGRGTLTVRTYRDQDNMRCAEVSDTGPGIDPKDVERVFDPFFTTKPPGKGTGLGLSVVYGVMTRHDGSIKIAKTGPEGTTFLVRLPAEAPKSLLELSEKMHPALTGEEEA